MVKDVELTEVLYAKKVINEFLTEDQLDRSNRQAHRTNHPEARAEENNPILEKVQRKEPINITSERIDLEDEDWEK